MIEVDLTVRITADNDAQADEILRALAESSRPWPTTPIVSITETRREWVA